MRAAGLHLFIYGNIMRRMNALSAINGIVVLFGIPSSIAGLIYIGRKLQILDQISLDVGILKHNSKVVTDYLTKYQTDFEPKELHAFSPLQLTNEGNGLISEIGFDDVFEEHRNEFFGFIDSEYPKLKYDVEASSIKSIYTLSDKPYMDFLKIFLYAHPERNMQNITPTLGVYIRDKYLERHPEITQ